MPVQCFLQFLCSFLKLELPSDLYVIDFREVVNSSCYIIFLGIRIQNKIYLLKYYYRVEYNVHMNIGDKI